VQAVDAGDRRVYRLSLLPCERRTRVHTAVVGVDCLLALLPEHVDADNAFLELEYRTRSVVLTRRRR